MAFDLKSPQRESRRTGPKTKLDLVFIQDTTGSQEPYIDASVARCKDVCITLQGSGQLDKVDGLRLAVIAFRDHSDEYVTKDFGGFTYNVDSIVSNLSALVADGGGDGPEALTAALDKALKLKWRADAAKIAVVITDAPPHGIGERDDDYYDGEPDGKDPLFVARAMSRRGIVLLIVACEPVLSNEYKFAHDFYVALAKITSGSMFPLTNTAILAPLIVGFVLEQVAIDALASVFRPIVTKFQQQGMSEAEIASKLFTLMQSKEIKVTTLESTKVYTEPEEAAETVSIWLKAKNTPSARDELLGIRSTPRVPETFTPPADPWPKNLVPITLKNLADFRVEYMYSEDGIKKDGVLTENQISGTPTMFYLNTPYMFNLRSGRKVESTTRTFTKRDDWDLAEYFN